MRFPRITLVAAGFLFGQCLHAADAVPEAWKETAAKAEAGDGEAMRELAKAYEDGTAIRKNLVTALGWYRKAADGGDADAAFKVGGMFEKGSGTKPDPALALRYYLQGSSAEGADAAIQRLVAADPELPKKLEAVAPAETKATLAKAATGDAEARYDLAELLFYQNGGLMRDENEGLRLMQLSAGQGYAPAQAWMAGAYAESDDAPTRLAGERFFAANAATSIEWLKKAAAQGHPGASYTLAGAYERGEGVERNYREAWRLYDIAAKANLEWAEGERDILGTEHPEAVDGPAGDAARAAWAENRKQAEAGEPAAAFALWTAYEKTKRPTEEETKQAFAWLKQAADGQQPGALLALSHCYRDGTVVAADKTEAARLRRAAAEKGSTDAAYELGLALRDGDGEEKNALEAFRWLHRAAKNKHAKAAEARDAMMSYELSQALIAAAPPETQALLKRGHDGEVKVRYQVGLLFLKGDGGLPPDMLQARNWLQLAAEAGLPEAEYAFGEFIARGRLERPDWAMAAGWYRKAADQGNADAQLALGYCYAAGLGVDKDLDQAGNWWRKASAQGKTEAAKAIADEEKNGHVFKDVAAEAMDEFSVLERKYGSEVPAGMKGETRKNFLRQAGAFDTTAIYQIALAYLNGKPEDGVAKDGATGERWMQRAADARHPSALAYFEDKANAARKAEAAKQVAAFEEAFAFAPNRHRRVELIKKFSRTMEDSNLSEEEKLELAMGAIAARAKERPEEAFDYVSAIERFRMSQDVIQKYFGADLAARIRTAAQKYLDDYNNPNSPSQQEWHGLPAGLTSRASAGDADAQYQLAEFYLSAQYHRDEGQAVELLQQAQAAGHKPAAEKLNQLARDIYQRGKQALDRRDQAEAGRLFIWASSLGIADADELIGESFALGWILPEARYDLALPWYRKAADRGDATALVQLARLHEGGLGVPKDEAQAAKLFRAAAERGNASGMVSLGKALLLGRGVAIDETEAVVWLRKAAEKKAAVALTWMKLVDPGASREDRAELALQTAGRTIYEDMGDVFVEPGELLDYAIVLGSEPAQLIKAKWHQREHLAEEPPEVAEGRKAFGAKKFPEAFALFKRAAEKGDPRAMRAIAGCYANGVGVEKDLTLARQWFEKTGEAGFVSGWVGAREIEAEIFYEAGQKAWGDVNGPEALKQWQRAAAMGHAAALIAIAHEYGVEKMFAGDFDEARRWFARAALFDPVSGKAELRRLDFRVAGRAEYLESRAAGERNDLPGVIAALEKAVAKGNSDAMFELGSAYDIGNGVEADPQHALALYDRAAGCSLNLARLAAQQLRQKLGIAGETTPVHELLQQAAAAQKAQRTADAIKLYERAANTGNVSAMTMLGLMYAPGGGATIDINLALAWFDRASWRGDEQAAMQAYLLRESKGLPQPGEKSKAATAASAETSAAGPAAQPVAASPAPMSVGEADAPVLPEKELKAKAEAGDALAQYDYGMLLRKKGDTAGASQWFHKALENPHASEEVKKWADMQTMDERLRAQWQSDREAKEAAKNAADAAEKEKKDAWAKAHPADGFYGAFDVWRRSPTFRDEALKNLYAAAKVAETGTAEIKYRLANIILQGTLGVPKDEARGRALLISSAEEGCMPAKLAYATGLLTGQAGFTMDAPKGKAMLAELVVGAETLVPEAKHQIALLLFQGGFGVAADKARALKLLEKNADDGFALSEFEFGRALLTGVPAVLPADSVRGVTYLKRVAGEGAPEAMALLGQVYERGVGAVAANPVEALAWYEKAEKAGMTQAKAAADRVRPQAQAKNAAAKK